MDPFGLFLAVIQKPEVIAALVAAALFGALVSYVAKGRRSGGFSFGPGPSARDAVPRESRPKLFAKREKAAPPPAAEEGDEDIEFHPEDEEGKD
jgi:hypothetical protein